jgi:hypothetical protein
VPLRESTYRKEKSDEETHGLPEITRRSHPRQSWSYRAASNKQGKYVGRVEINHAGLAAFTGIKGNKRLGNMSWERLFERLAKKQ